MFTPVSAARACSWNPGLERDQRALFRLVPDFDGVAADFAVLDVALEAGRQIQQHGDAFTAVGAGKGLFTDYEPLCARCALFHHLPLAMGSTGLMSVLFQVLPAGSQGVPLFFHP